MAVRYRATDKIMLDLLGGVNIAGTVRVENDDGGRIAEDDYDPAPFLGLKGVFLF